MKKKRKSEHIEKVLLSKKLKFEKILEMKKLKKEADEKYLNKDINENIKNSSKIHGNLQLKASNLIIY